MMHFSERIPVVKRRISVYDNIFISMRDVTEIGVGMLNLEFQYFSYGGTQRNLGFFIIKIYKRYFNY